MWPFLVFVVVLAGVIYPVIGAWTNQMVFGLRRLHHRPFDRRLGSARGRPDLGARKGKYGPDGRINPMPGANIPLATLGTFVLRLGWFGFNGGSQLALGSALDAAAMSIVFVNTNLAAAAGVVAAMALTQILYRKIDLTITLNGAIGGLVAITAGPDLQNHLLAIVVGGIGGAGGVRGAPARQTQDRRRGGRDFGLWSPGSGAPSPSASSTRAISWCSSSASSPSAPS